MCFLPYPSIPPPFSHYSAWIPLERSFRYSYSYRALEQIRAAFGVILFQYSPAFLVLLSADTARGFTLILLLFFSLFFKSIGVNACSTSILLLVFPHLSCITQCGYRQGYCTLTQFEHQSRLDAHLLFKKTEIILKIQAIYAASPQILFLHIFPLVRESEHQID